MTKKVYVYRDGELVLKEEAVPVNAVVSPLIMGDLPDFVSPVDGQVINGRAGLREHNRRHNVTNIADYTQQWQRQRAQRDKFYTEGPSRGVKEAMARAFNDLERRGR